MSTVVHLNITSWEGISVGAEHYYGKLTWPESDWSGHELQHILTEREAEYLNRKFGTSGLSVHYVAGEEHPGFNSKVSVRKAAIEKYKELCPTADFLVEGDPAHVEPKIVLAGEGQIMAAANKVYEEFEAINGYADPANEAKADTISKQWHDILKVPYR